MYIQCVIVGQVSLNLVIHTLLMHCVLMVSSMKNLTRYYSICLWLAEDSAQGENLTTTVLFVLSKHATQLQSFLFWRSRTGWYISTISGRIMKHARWEANDRKRERQALVRQLTVSVTQSLCDSLALTKNVWNLISLHFVYWLAFAMIMLLKKQPQNVSGL